MSFPGMEVSWAGSGRQDGEFCFGSDDGKLLFADAQGQKLKVIPTGDGPAEAVNGVAFIGNNAIAVSTRHEVVLLNEFTSEGAHRAVFHCGAHGVIATHDGHFVAPLGTSGLMTATPSQDEDQRFIVSIAPNRTLNYYSVVGLNSPGQPELLVCAVRSGGIATTSIASEGVTGEIRSIFSPGLDFIDVCSQATAASPRAVAAVSKDGTVALTADALYDVAPVKVKFNEVRGVAYRIFSVDGNIILLTSAGLYALDGLSRRFLAGEPVNRVPTRGGRIPIEAVDANICAEGTLLVVLPGTVLQLDVSLLCEVLLNPEHVEAALLSDFWRTLTQSDIGVKQEANSEWRPGSGLKSIWEAPHIDPLNSMAVA